MADINGKVPRTAIDCCLGRAFDFAPTAPGPLLRTTAEVGAALLELDTVAAEYAAARTMFNQRYNRLHDGHATERVIDAFFH